MSIRTKRVRVLDFSDIHLLHPRTPTRSIIQELDAVLNRNADLADVDIIFFSGDVFDNLVNIAQEDLHLVFDWIYRLLKLCKDLDIQLRILEGTPSHDWKQSRWFETINQRFDVHADLLYFPALAIEHNERYNLNILYVPDEWRSDTKETYQEVKQLLQEKHLEKVDIAIMHGAFLYQLPPIAQGKVPMHVEQDYLDIVKYFIFIGHVHKHSTFERIISPGSFSRLAHGEEEAKGYMDATIYDDDTFTVTFKENPLATHYVTIDVNTLADEQSVLQYVKDELKKHPPGSHIRIKAQAGHFAIANKVLYAVHFPEYIWTLTSEAKEKAITPQEQYDADETVIEIQQITIDKENVVSLLMDRLNQKVQDPNLLKVAEAILQQEVERG